VATKIEEINKAFGDESWKPIVHIKKQLDQKELAAWYQAADVLAVNPVRDGLNLIAKEFVACRQDEQGVLLLSKKAGCSAELSQGAIDVDPTSSSSFARGLSQALIMEPDEKRRRMTAMRRVIGWNRLHDWALGFLKEALTK
jgi:trehalose-6-phosphate synthase